MNSKPEEVLIDDISTEVIEGLTKQQKQISSKFFYDEKGSLLFDEICELDEYYPTRTEMKIMQDNIDEISSLLGEGTMLIELGSGSSVKIRLLLDNIPGLAGYIPIDISAEHLKLSAESLKKSYPNLDIFPLVADYTKTFELPKIENTYDHIAGFYPGSTIGNFHPDRAKLFLGRIARLIGKNGGLIIGVDLRKDKSILENAYNDAEGVTAKFNLNVLNHLNGKVDADFDLNKFKHHAFFNEDESRIEMHLVSLEEQKVNIADTQIHFGKNEHIITEYSYKYTLESFKKLVLGNYDVRKVWCDKNNLFSIQYLRVK